MTFQERLKYYREKAGYKSAKEFAEKLGMGYTTYVAYENKDREPRYKTLCKIARILKTSPNELLDFDPDHPDELEKAIQLLKEGGIRIADNSPAGCISLYVHVPYLDTFPNTKKAMASSPIPYRYEKVIEIAHRVKEEMQRLETDKLPKITEKVITDVFVEDFLGEALKNGSIPIGPAFQGKPDK